MSAPLLSVNGLRIDHRDGDERRTLVHDISFAIGEGEVLGLVGESGSGKSLTAYAIAGLLPPGVEVGGGRASLGGTELTALDKRARRALAGDRIGLVFQDPLSSFNPVRKVGANLIESAMRHQRIDRRTARNLAVAALGEMALPQPDLLIDAYPHQLSGGQRQRVMIALALINGPSLLIADEPTTALDATVQRAILALLKRQAPGRATPKNTPHQGGAAPRSDRIAVKRERRIIECGPARALLDSPAEPYTRALVAARLRLSPAGARP